MYRMSILPRMKVGETCFSIYMEWKRIVKNIGKYREQRERRERKKKLSKKEKDF